MISHVNSCKSADQLFTRSCELRQGLMTDTSYIVCAGEFGTIRLRLGGLNHVNTAPGNGSQH